jgi:hypothetical protein
MDDATKVFSQLGSIQGVKPEDIYGKQGLGNLALFGAPGGGQTTDKAVDAIRMLMETQGMSAGGAGGTYSHLMEMGKQFGAASSKYVDSVLQVTKANTQYGLEVGNAAALTKQFWGALQEGKMSLEDIGKMATIGTRMPEGAMAFAASQILQNIPGLEMLRGQSAVGGGEMVRRIMYANELPGEHGVSADQLEHRRQSATQGVFSWASNQSAAMGGGAAEQEAYTRKFLASMGINFSNLSPEKESALWEAMKSGNWNKNSAAALNMSMQDPQVAAMENIGEILRGQMASPLTEIAQTVKSLLSIVGHSFLMLADFFVLHRHDEAFKEASSIRGEINGLIKLGAIAGQSEGNEGNAHVLKGYDPKAMGGFTEEWHKFGLDRGVNTRFSRGGFSSPEDAKRHLEQALAEMPAASRSYALSQLAHSAVVQNHQGNYVIKLQYPGGDEAAKIHVSVKNGQLVIDDGGRGGPPHVRAVGGRHV